ncbi:hypothetical protein SUGI_0315430 [Cryptomeria japonica]|nr:hypothetical protein SUGI_0315430 [Cryptomeria japonica]
MVIQVGLAKFYGSSLPRPQIYEDVKYNSERVDPPTPPSAPLLSWAREVTWSMGGLASKRRKRSQGKIEGSLKKLRDLQDDDDDDGEGLHFPEKLLPGLELGRRRERRSTGETEIKCKMSLHHFEELYGPY